MVDGEDNLHKGLLQQVIPIARQAGDAIMEVYESEDFDVETKEDQGFVSPLTKADKAANDIIVAELIKISDLPVISEENEQREADGEFWLVDPLDGTKEFIKRNGEFTVNIALVKNKRPVLGVVYVPALNMLYTGDVGRNVAFKIDAEGKHATITAQAKSDTPVIVSSRSHKDPRVEKLLEQIGDHEEISMGSSLKLCLVAEGKAMLYPRLAPTYLWDTAAADAVVAAAGGKVRSAQTGELLAYDPAANMKNPEFVVESANNTIEWENILNVS